MTQLPTTVRTTIFELAFTATRDAVEEIPAKLIGLAGCDAWVMSHRTYGRFRMAVADRTAMKAPVVVDGIHIPLFTIRIVADRYLSDQLILGMKNGRPRCVVTVEEPLLAPGG